MQVIKAKVEFVAGRPRIREAKPRERAITPMTNEEFERLLNAQQAADALDDELRHHAKIASMLHGDEED